MAGNSPLLKTLNAIPVMLIYVLDVTIGVTVVVTRVIKIDKINNATCVWIILNKETMADGNS